MGNVLLVELATILLAVFTALQRIYQKQTGTAPATGLAYNALLGLFAAVLFWAMCGFKFEFTPYSAAIAAGEALLAIAYTLLGFCVMREGGMVLYTACAMGKQPACMLFSKPIDSLAASGAILAANWTQAKMPVVDSLGEEFLAYVKEQKAGRHRNSGRIKRRKQ